MSELIREECCNCGIEFAMPKNWKNILLDNHERFYCPRGHSQHYTGETVAEKLEKRNKSLVQQKGWADDRGDRWERNAEFYKNQARAYKGHMTRLKNKMAMEETPKVFKFPPQSHRLD